MIMVLAPHKNVKPRGRVATDRAEVTADGSGPAE
jgi:hypothetical protein